MVKSLSWSLFNSLRPHFSTRYKKRTIGCISCNISTPLGFKLASPKVFKNAYNQGVEQLLFLSSTLIITLYSDLLYGIAGGILITLLLHIFTSKGRLHPFL